MRAAKVDSTARELTAVARKLGIHVLYLGGTIDALFLIRNRPVMIEFKGPKTKHTPAQQRLLEQGWPLVTIRSVDDVLNLLGKEG